MERLTERLNLLELSAGATFVHEVVKHEQRVEALVGDFADALALPLAERREARLAGRFHDIGKLRVPPEIIFKPGALDRNERHVVELHGALGVDIISEAHEELPDGLREAVLYHHERWDGLGYEGVKGPDIPHVARLLSIVDVFDALTADRVYRPAMTEAEALRQMIAQCNGVDAMWFDPCLFRQFIAWRCDASSALTPEQIEELRAYPSADLPP
nr:HD domain-containing phosphohydrolase [uncultured Roseococcus sp.]